MLNAMLAIKRVPAMLMGIYLVRLENKGKAGTIISHRSRPLSLLRPPSTQTMEGRYGVHLTVCYHYMWPLHLQPGQWTNYYVPATLNDRQRETLKQLHMIITIHQSEPSSARTSLYNRPVETNHCNYCMPIRCIPVTVNKYRTGHNN